MRVKIAEKTADRMSCLMEDAYEVKVGGWISLESYVLSKVRVFEYLPGDEARACPEVLVEPLPKVCGVQIKRG